ESEPLSQGSAREDLVRLARIVARDIILYNPGTAEKEISAGRFFETFAAEIREGESLVAERFPVLPGGRDLFHETLKVAIQQYGVAAGLPVVPGR
ncbi:MAG: hypothetical protein ACE5ID_03560, partial [Acidobacteriota bacterium]